MNSEDVIKMAFGRIRNGTLFYDGNTLYRKKARGSSFGENAQSVDNPQFKEFFNDNEVVEVSKDQPPEHQAEET